MRILVDPDELGSAAEVLRQCSVEVADIGSQLSGCADCPMPPAVAADVSALMSAVDVLLDRVGEGFVNDAIGLVGRAIVAALDSLAAASSATLPSVGVIGGNTVPGYTILDPNGKPVESVLPAVGVIGGNPSPYPAFTFSPQTSTGAGSQDLRGIQFLEPLPVMPEPRGFVPRAGDPANQMAINSFMGGINTQALTNIRYNTYASNENTWGRTPMDAEDISL
ncbi:MAG TPA: hypothetical protein VIH06_12300 [Ilumatobacteraceae bacterium]